MDLSTIAKQNHRNRVIQGLSVERIQRSVGNRLMNKLGRFNSVRDFMSAGYVGKKDVRSDLFPNVAPEDVQQDLLKDGIWRGFKLPELILSELEEFSLNSPAYGNRNPHWGYRVSDKERAEDAVGTHFVIANYPNAYGDCPAVQRIAHDPVIHEVALRYVGPRAKLLGTSMWWSYPSNIVPISQTEQNEYAQLFHYDLDDYKFIKFFFYLTNVSKESGPHVYVKGTHRAKPLMHLYPMRRLKDVEIHKTYRASSICHIEGMAGEGFVEDTFGIHKGLTPETKSRLILQLYFAISKGFTDCYEPSIYQMIDLE